MKKGINSKKHVSITDFCDLLCKYARLPKDSAVDGSGSCRTFLALYCDLKKKLVHKNMPCTSKEMEGKRG
ncbi:MAG: hypothetical protein N2745_06535 [Syntrophorhabdaceae bacterium]|nr:hypothetical protein [Syntrophorhabdaceae bacterium]